MSGPEDWTQEQCIDQAEECMEEASQRIPPFDDRTPIETLLLFSIAASNLAIAKSQPKRRKTT